MGQDGTRRDKTGQDGIGWDRTEQGKTEFSITLDQNPTYRSDNGYESYLLRIVHMIQMDILA